MRVILKNGCDFDVSMEDAKVLSKQLRDDSTVHFSQSSRDRLDWHIDLKEVCAIV